MMNRWMPDRLREEIEGWFVEAARAELLTLSDDALMERLHGAAGGCDLDNKTRTIRAHAEKIDLLMEHGACAYCGAPCREFDSSCPTWGCEGSLLDASGRRKP